MFKFSGGFPSPCAWIPGWLDNGVLSKSTSEWRCPDLCVDNDGDGYYGSQNCSQGNDCDDNNAAIHPGAMEICDGKDNNCDGQIDEGLNKTWYKDADGDGYTTGETQQGCSRPTGYVLSAQPGDCDDNNAAINPNTIWYKDADGDGYTDGITAGPKCQRPAGYKLASELTSMEKDCDDNDSSKNPQHPCCDLNVSSFTGSNALLNPSSGGAVTLNGNISDSSGKPTSWKITLPNGQSTTGTGKTATATWDGKINGKLPDLKPGQSAKYTATLDAWKTEDPNCKDSKPTKITITMTKDCKLQVSFGSTANLASGALSHSQERFSTRGAGLTTSMTLYYNSLESYNGSLGMGWIHNYDIAIGESSDGYVVLRQGDGGRKVYTNNGGSYTSQPGDYFILTKNADGSFTITNKDGLRYNFNTVGKIASIVDRNSNTMTFAYPNGDLTTITDSAGRITTLSYNADHRIATINDPNGNTHSFTYSGNDLAGVTTQPRGSQSDAVTWSYSYYANSFMQSKTDPNGYTTTYTYDENYRIVGSTDPEGKIRSITYPSPDDTSQAKSTTFTEKDGGVWTYTYDTPAGMLTQKTDPENGTTSYTYDANRNMTSKTEADGSVTTYTYDTSGNMASTTDALNQTTAYTYNAYGQVTSVTAPDNTTTTYEYDTSGNLTKTTDSTGAATSYQYDSKGNLTSITNAAGQTTTFTYDQYGNLSSIKDSTGATTTFTYDTAGNMTSQTDASGATTYFQYNALNQLVKVIDPNGNSTTNTYDKNGNKTSSTDDNGNTTYYEYNYKGQLIKVKDALGNITIYTYGGTGCASCGGGTDKLTAITDANGNSTKYEYDYLGRLTKETSPLGNSISYSYDSKGNLISKTDANGATISFSYDSLGRLLKKAYPDNTTERFTYDSKGNIVTATNANTSYSFTYSTSGKVANVSDSSGRTVSYQYDSLGNKTKLIYPEGSTVTYSYDSANRLKSIVNGGGKTYTFTYDSLGRRSKLSLPNGAYASYSYDNSGRLTGLSHKTSSGSTIASFAYTHDNVGNRLTKSLDTGTKYTYSYDSTYRLTEALSSTPGYSSNTNAKGSGIATATQQQKEFYTYDPVGNRLTSDTYSTYTYNQNNQLLSNGGTYGYDKSGNLVMKIEGTTTFNYAYDYENRLTKVVKTEDGTTTTSEYKYDPFGRRIEKKVTENGATTTTRYLYDNEDIILEYDGSGNIGNRYIHGPGIDEPLAVINGKNTYYYHADGLGSIVALTDSSGKIQQTYEYDSFGNLKDQKNKVKQPYTYTGREWDKEAGLYYLRARYYDPMGGRFISFDPILRGINHTEGTSCRKSITDFPLKHPQKLHPFIYTDNNPINFIDPKGLACGPGTLGDLIWPDIWMKAIDFTSACTNHDNCYEMCGKTKPECDGAFLKDMKTVCSNIPNLYYSDCLIIAYSQYYLVLSPGGQYSYNKAQKDACCSK